ncbi:hypothetical protein ABTK01_20255, partial [Acinetobacter baumannii]
SIGNKQQTTITDFTLKKDTTAKKDSVKAVVTTPLVKIPKIRPIQLKRSLNIDTKASIAYMRLTTFGRARLKKFFRQSFRTLHKSKTKNLII